MTTYYTLGNSGLRVSRLALGTMTFGTDSGRDADQTTARQLFDRYVATGGRYEKVVFFPPSLKLPRTGALLR